MVNKARFTQYINFQRLRFLSRFQRDTGSCITGFNQKPTVHTQGVIVLIAFLALGIILFSGTYFLSFAWTESRISKGQEIGTRTYYLAEAGINEAIWKLQNEEPWKTCFISSGGGCPDCGTWSASFSKSNIFFERDSYTVTIQNSACGRGEITATSTIEIEEGKTAQRVVRVQVFKSIASLTQNSAVFSGGPSENVEIRYTSLEIKNGNLFSNHNLDIKGWSEVKVRDNPGTENLEGQILAVGNLNISNDSQVENCETKCAKNACATCTNAVFGGTCEKCPPGSLSAPRVDFDSASSTSFKNRALAAEASGQCEMLCNGSPCVSQCGGVLCKDKCIFTSLEFEKLLWEVGENRTLTLNTESNPGIVYVTGPVELRGGRRLVINGALVADDNIDIGERYKWTRGGRTDEGFSQIIINRPTATTPSGLLTKRKIDFGLYSSFTTTTIKGVIYANDEFSIVSIPNTLEIKGGIIARKLRLLTFWQPLEVTLDNEVIFYGLGYKIDGEIIDPTYSPAIMVEHWEEVY